MNHDLGQDWRKSSYSGTQGGNCVEVCWDERGLLTRDSKNPDGEILKFAGPAFMALVTAVKVGKLDC